VRALNASAADVGGGCSGEAMGAMGEVVGTMALVEPNPDDGAEGSTVVVGMAVVGATGAEEDMVSDTSLLRRRALLRRK
jgi:hypothetical protein